MGDIIKFQPIKLADAAQEDSRTVFQCKCGCQIFWVLAEGLIQCIACKAETPTIEVF